MLARDPPLRYAYVKNGDAVEQVRRILRQTEDPSGPDAFIGDFIRAHAGEPVLVLCRSNRSERLVQENLVAESHSVSGWGPSWLRRWWSAIRVGIAVARWRPERIVCGCVAETLWVCVVVAKLLRVPLVCSRHSGLVERNGLAGVVSGLDAVCIRACAAVVCHGPFLAHQVRELGVAEAKIHQFDVDLRGFVDSCAPAPPIEPFTPGTLLVMYVGRIQANKGALDLLQAFATCVASGGLRAGLVYVGTGKDEDNLRRAIASAKLSEHVRLVGSVEHARLPALIRQAAVVAAPTQPGLVEGRCMVVLESMSLGVPVIAPDYAAFPYAVRHEVDGLLYRAGSVEALADGLSRILTDGALRERLRKGAEATGLRLLVNPPGFAHAVDAAFAPQLPRPVAGPSRD